MNIFYNFQRISFYILQLHFSALKNRACSVSNVTGYRLNDWGSILGRGRHSSLYHRFWTDSGVYLASHSILVGVNRSKREANSSKQVVLRLMHGDLLPTHASSWHGA